MEGEGSRLGTASGSAARYIANRMSRRSFLGRLGQGAIVTAMGTSGLTLLAQSAFAHSPNPCVCGQCTGDNGNCCSRDSIGCGSLPGWNDSNNCPPGSELCGCWTVTVSSGTCASGIREWCDCCKGCGTPANCQCITGDDGLTHPSCCRHKFYTGFQANACDHIRCRRRRCVGSHGGGNLC